VQRRDDGKLRVRADDLSLDGFTVEYDGTTEDGPDIDVSESLVSAAMGYVDGAIEQVREVTGEDDAGFDVTIESDIPLGAGLGSSAAVVVAAIDAATRELGVTLETAELAERAYQTESWVQDGQASRADTFCSATGGAVRVEGEDCRTLEAPDLPIVIGFDGGAGIPASWSRAFENSARSTISRLTRSKRSATWSGTARTRSPTATSRRSVG